MAWLIVAAALAAGCATSSALRDGRKPPSVPTTTTGPSSSTPRRSRRTPTTSTRAWPWIAQSCAPPELHFARGRRLYATGKFEEALVEMQLAAELNPGNGDIEAELRRTRVGLRTKLAIPIDGKTRLESLVERSRDMQPAGLELPRDVKLPSSAMVFRDAGVRDVLTVMARLANVNVVFDPAFRDASITIELRDPEFESALTSVTSSTRNFYKVTAPRTITIVPDTPAKRREYRGRGRADVLPEQRRAQGHHRPAPHRRGPAPARRRAGHQRDHDQGHAGAAGCCRANHHRD